MAWGIGATTVDKSNKSMLTLSLHYTGVETDNK